MAAIFEVFGVRHFAGSLVGVDRGSVMLFSDFENGGPMWTGHGPREVRHLITFKSAFKGIPVVQANISMWDMDRRTNMRGDLSVEEITATGCTIVFKTWDDTRIARLRADWLAIGEIPAEDDWDVI